MEQNVGGYDRIARLIVGPPLSFAGKAAFLGLISLNQALAVLAVVVGFVLVISGATGRCLVHSALDVDTTTG